MFELIDSWVDYILRQWFPVIILALLFIIRLILQIAAEELIHMLFRRPLAMLRKLLRRRK